MKKVLSLGMAVVLTLLQMQVMRVDTQSYGLWRQDGKQRDNCNAGTGTDRVRSERKGDDAGRLQCGAGSDQMVWRTV